MNDTSKTNRFKKGLRFGAGLVLLGLLLLVALVVSIRFGAFGPLPSVEQIQDIDRPQASVVLSDEGQILGKYFLENRTDVGYEDVSPHIVNALIATEDKRFYGHHGIDWQSMGRVLVKSILLQDERSGGGSTLSQQLAKNLFPRQSYRFLSLFINKVREMIIARRIERSLDKKQILTLYLNTVSFGGTTFGIKAACRQFFDKMPDEIQIEEAALLVGLLKATTFYHPRTDILRSQVRRNVVLNQMLASGYLEGESIDSLCELPVLLNWIDESHDQGVAPYFREMLRQYLQQFLDTYNADHQSDYNLYTDGLKIHTTIDWAQQVAAEKAIRKRMKPLQQLFDRHWPNHRPWNDPSVVRGLSKQSGRYTAYQKMGYPPQKIDSLLETEIPMRIFNWEGERQVAMSPVDSIRMATGLLHAGLLSMDPASGAIKSWVGGIDYTHFKYDHVLSRRQTGSIFKPVVYARALEMGYTPCDYFENELITYEDYDDWTPHNADDEYGGYYSLQGALSHSVNTISVALALESGIDSVIDLASRMGISNTLPQVPSLSLGTGEVSLLDMVQMYSTIANNGQYQPHYFIEYIVAPSSDTLYQHQRVQPAQILDEQHAQLITHMLTRTIRNGTGKSMRSIYGIYDDIAGKTGTTQSHADGWFVGYTPELVAGVWVGGDIPLVKFRTLELGQGAHTALPIWAYWYKDFISNRGNKNTLAASFSDLPQEWEMRIDCDDFVESLHWTDLLEEWFVQESERRRSDRKNSRRSRKKERQSGLSLFFKKLFKKKN